MDEILNLIESVSEGFPSYFFNSLCLQTISCNYYVNKVNRLCKFSFIKTNHDLN